MERIKQALERAQSQRGGAPSPVSPAQGQPPHPQPQIEGPVSYTSTRVVPLNKKRAASSRVVTGLHDEPATAAYKVLRTQVLQRLRARNWNAIAVTSSGPNEGKTLTAINLAIGLAQESNHTVLLVDFDLRNPSVLGYLGVETEHGIVDHLLRDVPLTDVLINPGIDSLVVAPGKERVRNSSELLSSPRTVRLVEELRTRYPSRILVFDLPPLLSADDALAFAPFVDAVLLVVEEGETARAALRHSLDFLGDTPVLGTVLNKSSDTGPSYYY